MISIKDYHKEYIEQNKEEKGLRNILKWSGVHPYLNCVRDGFRYNSIRHIITHVLKGSELVNVTETDGQGFKLLVDDKLKEFIEKVKIKIFETMIEINQIIVNAPRLDREIIVYRGGDRNQYTTSDIITDRGFSSWTFSEKIARDFAENKKGELIKIKLNEKTPCLILCDFSKTPEEEEIILPPGVIFKRNIDNNLEIIGQNTDFLNKKEIMFAKESFEVIKAFVHSDVILPRNNNNRSLLKRIGINRNRRNKTQKGSGKPSFNPRKSYKRKSNLGSN